MFRRAATLVILSGLAGASPALAQRTFASFDVRPDAATRTRNIQVTGGTNTTITGYSVRTGASSSTDFIKAYATNGTPLSQVGQVFFNFTAFSGLGSGIQANMFFVNAQSAVPTPNVTSFITPGFTGSLVFKPIESGTFANERTYTPSSILLAANFQDGVLIRARQAKSFGDSTGNPNDGDYMANAVSFYSDFLTFGSSDMPDRGLSTSFTGDVSSGANSFIASLNGSFEDAGTIMESGRPVPELSTWGMMIVGFGAVGSTLRRRRGARAGKALATA